MVFLLLNYLYIYLRYGAMDTLIYSLWERSRARVHVV